MAYFEVLKELQETTLIRERLLSRLRTELSRFVRGSGNEELVKDLVEDLRFNRRNYINLTTKISKGSMLSDDVNRELYTLLEYNVLVALNNELELLSKISRYIQEGKIRLLMLDEIYDDIESVNDIMIRFVNLIPAFKEDQ
ncbi:MAG: hypothetical protein QXO98_02900 [Sulfolobales archaeon]